MGSEISASDRPVVVARFTNLIDAELAKSVLDGAGIACALQNDHVVGVLPHLYNAVGGVEVCVGEDDVEAARTLLEEPFPKEPPKDPRLSAADDLPEGDEVDVPTPADAQATRAFRAAVLALLILPGILNVYSVYLLWTLRRLPGELSARGRRHATLAVVFNLLLGWIPAALLWAEHR